MDNRTKDIEASITEAETKYGEAMQLKEQYEEKLDEIKIERSQIIEEATQRAKTRGLQIVSSAEEDAKKILERAREQVEREKQNMLNELKGEVSQLAIAVAEKLIEKNLDEKAHQQIIQQFIDKAGETKWLN